MTESEIAAGPERKTDSINFHRHNLRTQGCQVLEGHQICLGGGDLVSYSSADPKC